MLWVPRCGCKSIFLLRVSSFQGRTQVRTKLPLPTVPVGTTSQGSSSSQAPTMGPLSDPSHPTQGQTQIQVIPPWAGSDLDPSHPLPRVGPQSGPRQPLARGQSDPIQNRSSRLLPQPRPWIRQTQGQQNEGFAPPVSTTQVIQTMGHSESLRQSRSIRGAGCSPDPPPTPRRPQRPSVFPRQRRSSVCKEAPTATLHC